MGFFICLISVLSVHLAGGERVKDSIYTDFTNFHACFKRLNGTMEFGCTSELSGNVGVLQYIDSTDISRVERSDHAPYVVLLSPEVFSGDLLRKMKSTGNINGIILPGIKNGRWKGKRPVKQSDDIKCPNSGASLYSEPAQQCGSLTQPWNPAGENVLWENWNFPIFHIEDENTTESLYNCFNQHNSAEDADWPLCAVELSSPMYAAKDSETCWRRTNLLNSLTPQHYCDPLSDNNVVYFTSARNATSPGNTTISQGKKSVIVVLARLDALNIFDKLEVGFDSPVSGLVTFLAAAKLVKQALTSRPSYVDGVENIMFLLVHGESFDYIGSTRVVYDMQNEKFPFDNDEQLKNGIRNNGTQPPLDLESIKFIIELGQLSNLKGSEVFYHTANKNGDINGIISSLSQSRVQIRPSSLSVLPPCSSHTFLKEKDDIPILMLSNFDREYANDYFHSIYDNSIVHNYNHSKGADQSVVRHLSSVSAAVAASIITAASGAQPITQADPDLMNELLHCYTESANCSLYREASSPTNFPWTDPKPSDEPLAQYISVQVSGHTMLTKQILQYFTGDTLPQTSLDCPNGNCDASDETTESLDDQEIACLKKNGNQLIYSYIFLVGSNCYNSSGPYCGKCYQTSVSRLLAVSPAFDSDVIDDYDWSSGKYPTWTESIWKSLNGRMFLMASPASQHVTLAIGVIVVVFSFLGTWAIERKADLIFPTSPTQLPPSQSTPVSL